MLKSWILSLFKRFLFRCSIGFQFVDSWTACVQAMQNELPCWSWNQEVRILIREQNIIFKQFLRYMHHISCDNVRELWFHFIHTHTLCSSCYLNDAFSLTYLYTDFTYCYCLFGGQSEYVTIQQLDTET